MGRGGAEVMLVKVLPQLKEYHNIVVTLNPQNHFGETFQPDEYHCLHMGSFKNFPLAVLRLRKFIKQHQVDLVHSHLFTSTLVARLAVPAGIPLVTTIHTNVTASNEYKKWYIKLLDGIGYKAHKSTIIGVSAKVLEQYFEFLHHTPYKKHLLYTFVDTKDLENLPIPEKTAGSNTFRLIAIGSLRYPKNQQYLINAFKSLREENIELHIYGDGNLRSQLEQQISESKVKVVLKGEVEDASKLMPQYDAYVMSSEFEGFSLSVLEAMAMQMPMLLSDIPSFREQCADTAIFFDLNDTADFAGKLKALVKNGPLRKTLALAAKERVMNNFTLEHHMAGLRKIYAEALNGN